MPVQAVGSSCRCARSVPPPQGKRPHSLPEVPPDFDIGTWNNFGPRDWR
jgi:hypothetical protein